MFWLKDKTVLITGGTGSFGRRCAQVLLEQAQLKRLILLSRDEQKHVALRRTQFPPGQYPQVRWFVGDVRDEARLRTALRGVDYVIHAAAMKHVDMAEYNPQECIATNIGGAQNVIQACIESGVQKVVALSTDKAASPINLYGATKLCSDKLFVASNSLAGQGGTRFSVVRYGNVLNSNGSVVPFFLNQRHTGVLPITDPEMSRFIITLEQGVWFVLDAMRKMAGGEVFIPKIPSVTIMDIAQAVAPKCQTKIVGIRPGEKLHECMIPADEARLAIEFEDHFIIKPLQRSWDSETPWYEISGTPCENGFSYTSDANDLWLSPEQLRDMIRVEFPDCDQDIAGRAARVESRMAAPAPPRNAQRLRIGTETDCPVIEAPLPYSTQSIDENDIRAVTNAMRSGWLTTGPAVTEFETAVAQYCGCRHAVSFCNGTAALHAAVAALDVKPGDEVIVPALTFVATANAAVYCGATPVFADVCPDTLLLDLADVESKISEKTTAIISVDFAGQTCDYAGLGQLADRHDLKLISDSCHALGGTFAGQPVCDWVDLACYSFHPVKQITTGEGGMVAGNDSELIGALARFRNHGIDTDFRQRSNSGKLIYDMQSAGFNYRLSDIQCALGVAQLKKLPAWERRRLEIAELYCQQLQGMPHVRPLGRSATSSHGYHLFVVRWDNELAAIDRDEAISALRNGGIGANIHYRPVYQHSFYRNSLAIRKQPYCPTAESAFAEIISLPIFPAMADKDVCRVCEMLDRLGTTSKKISRVV